MGKVVPRGVWGSFLRTPARHSRNGGEGPGMESDEHPVLGGSGLSGRDSERSSGLVTFPLEAGSDNCGDLDG